MSKVYIHTNVVIVAIIHRKEGKTKKSNGVLYVSKSIYFNNIMAQ